MISLACLNGFLKASKQNLVPIGKTWVSAVSVSTKKFNHQSKFLRYCSSKTVDAEILSEGDEKIKLDSNENVVKKEQEGIIEEVEVSLGKGEMHSFQTETQKILDIVAHSLYSDRDVFVREIISNSSDALEKLRYIQATNIEVIEPELPLEIRIFVDEKKKQFILKDTGIGMSRDELVKNLGTIAHSGTSGFTKKLEELKDINAASVKSGIIGQFGVGFYSTFMVGKSIKVYTKSSTPGSIGYLWKSEGMGEYSVAEADNVQRGTKIVIDLKDDCEQYSKVSVVRDLIQNMSSFVGFPIFLNGEHLNTLPPIWTMEPKNVTDEMHNKFYRFIATAWEDPKYKLQFKTDVPFDIKAVFYVVPSHMEKLGMGRLESTVALYCKRVLIDKNMNVLPQWLRFVKGVVDSPDISLNISRELLQDSTVVKRMSELFVNKIVRMLQNQLKKDSASYDSWYKDFGMFLKEGACVESGSLRNDICKLLRFESSCLDAGVNTGFVDYISRMKPDSKKEILYLMVPNRETAIKSPYLEGVGDKEVLFTYEPLDEFVMSHLTTFDDVSIVSVSSSSSVQDVKDDLKSTPSDEELRSWVETTLTKDLVKEVKLSTRLNKSPAIVTDQESASIRRMMSMIDGSNSLRIGPQVFEINPRHPIFEKLANSRVQNPEIASKCLRQIYDNALISAGMMDDPRVMIERLNEIVLTAIPEVVKSE